MNINIQSNSSTAFKRNAEKYEQEILRYFESQDYTLSVHLCENFKNLEQLDTDNSVYIVSSRPHHVLENLERISISEGHIFTIIGESRLLYTSRSARLISEYLFKESYLTHAQSLQYFTALQECLLNAIEHGNLNLSKDKKDGLSMLDNIERYHKVIEDHLNNSSRGSKLVTVTCEVKDELIVTSVEDQGEGYDVEKVLKERKKTHTLMHSRGIRLIEGLTDSYHILKNGKRIDFAMQALFLSHHNFTQSSMMDTRHKSKILIIDDQEANTKIAKFYLESVGYTSVYTANSAAEGIALAQEIIPDLILLDIVMPDINGFAACRKIKLMEECQNIPILFFSSLDDTQTRIKGYRLGAVDYVAKPLQKNELIARTDAHIQNGLLYKSLNAYVEKVNNDMSRAKQAQIELLPSSEKLLGIKKKYELEVSACFKTCYELAGDYWTVEDLDDGRVAILMADFTGHGVAASLNTVRLHAFIQEFYHYLQEDIESFVYKINQRLKSTIPLEDFATFVCAIFDTTKNELTYIGCGNPPIAVIPYKKDAKCKFLSCEGLPLGIEDSGKFSLRKQRIQLDDGDSLMLFSDALIEARHKTDNEMWGEKKLLQKLNEIKDQYTYPNLDDILETFNETAKKPLMDDLTILHITYKGNNVSKELLQSYMHPDALLTELSG